jgi:hypothetical protein
MPLISSVMMNCKTQLIGYKLLNPLLVAPWLIKSNSLCGCIEPPSFKTCNDTEINLCVRLNNVSLLLPLYSLLCRVEAKILDD